MYAAIDTLTGDPVAIKRIPVVRSADRPRLRREVTALRLLRVPGVVTLLDDGPDDEGGWFIVMERVDGRPFPGGPAPGGPPPRRGPVPWPVLRRTVLPLLATLGQVHAAGIVHRDLKPDNVLVLPDGQPVLLDFGIARGQGVGPTVTRPGQLVGTPAFMAPEVLLGRPHGVRADLYALALMVYEALAGAPAFDDGAPIGLRLRAPPLLRDVAPDTPRAVAIAIDACLSPVVGDRPASAEELAARLGGDATRARLPWLGDDGPIRAVVEAALAGRSLAVGGPRGSGRTRVLEEAAGRLLAVGVVVGHTVPGRRPFSSLVSVLGEVSDGSLADATAEVTRRIAALDRPLFADTGVDPWTARVLAGLPRVVRAVDQDAIRDGDIHLRPLTEPALRGLFVGPERLLHRRSRGAALVWRRSGGNPGRVAACVEAWLARRLARWTAGGLELDPAASTVRPHPHGRHSGPAEQHEADVLLAWLHLAERPPTSDVLAAVTGWPRWEVEGHLLAMQERGSADHVEGAWRPLSASQCALGWSDDERREAHRRLAEVLPDADPTRWRHLLVAQALDAGGAAVAEVVFDAIDRGALPTAHAAAVALAVAGRGADAAEHEARATALLAEIALAKRADRDLDRALYDLGRAAHRTDEICRWEALVRARAYAVRGASQQAREALHTLDDLGPFASRRGRRWAWIVRADVAKADPDALLRHADAIDGRGPEGRGLALGYRGLIAYRRGQFAEAARFHERSLEFRTTTLSRCSALYNAAAAWTDAHALEACTRTATALREAAEAAGLTRFEARAEVLLRGAAYRAGAALDPEPELEQAMTALGIAHTEARFFVTEAAAAWRAGDPRQCRLARGAVGAGVRCGPGALRTLADGLGALAGLPTDLDAVAAATHTIPPGVAVQVLGMLRGRDDRADWRAEAARRAAEVPPATRSQRREVLSIDEALADIPPAPAQPGRRLH